MRLLSLILMVVAFSLIGYDANSQTVKDIYDACKSYPEKTSEFSELSGVEQQDAVYCMGYIHGAISQRIENCKWLSAYNESIAETKKEKRITRSLSNILAYHNEQFTLKKIVIQIKQWAKNNTDKWGESLASNWNLILDNHKCSSSQKYNGE